MELEEMSRLYVWLDTDTIKTTRTARGNERAEIQINYGSKDDSIPLCSIEVYYPHTNLKDDPSEPKVFANIKGKVFEA
jgi:hypothetical protein